MQQSSQTPNRTPWKQTISAIATFSAVLVTAVLSVSAPTRATTPEQATISDILGNSSELTIRRGSRRESVQTGSTLQQVRDALITVPPNNAYALLRFLSGRGEDLNLYIQTNSHPSPAIYHFPCRTQGGNYFIGWGLERNAARGCETGMQVMRGNTTRIQADDSPASSSLALLLKQLTQAPARQTFYCSAAGNDGKLSFTTATSGDPCTEAVKLCQGAGGVGCATVTTGFWWTNEERLRATLDCANNQSFGDEGTGTTIEAQVQTLIQQTQGQSCTVQIYRPQDFVAIPAPDDVVLAQGDNEILVQVRDTETGLQVDVLEGAINVRSHNSPDLQLITQGQRYIHSETSSEITTFDRTETYRAVDMEVLCALAAQETNRLSIAACRAANLTPGSGQPRLAFCNREQGSGGQLGDRRTLQMGTNRGEIELEYEMYVVPDRFQIIYEGQEILDTGFIGGSGRLSIPFSGRSGRVDVIVTGNQISTTQWNYTLRCPR